MKREGYFSPESGPNIRRWQRGAALAAAGCLMAFSAVASSLVEVELRLESDTVPEGSQVYVTGSEPDLGSWSPNEVAMTRTPDGAWSKTLTVRTGTALEYKFTLGSWITEALDDKGWVPGNHVVEIQGATTIVTRVKGWNNDGKMPEGGITGTARYHRKVGGEGVVERDIVVWLPPGYETDTGTRYPVLYAHDGQNLFDPATSFLGVDWGLDETATALIEAGKLKPLIIVGIYNTLDRTDEYSNSEKGRAYMAYLTKVVKPMIDADYRTLADRDHTATMGSSVGGLISFLLTWKHPEVFGQAACLSPAFLYGAPDHAVKLVTQGDRPRQPIRLYIDSGGRDIEARLKPGCDQMLEALKKAGFTEGVDYVWYFDEEAGHNEAAWGRRAEQPLTFLFGTGKSG